jgi:energy-coupling factor transport system ATP-binding protein
LIAEFDRLSYWYPGAAGAALSEVCGELEAGLTLLAGRSGAGKSTLLKVLNGLVPNFHGGRIAGRASVAGLVVPGTRTAELAARVGFVFQDPELQPVRRTVERDVAFGLENLAVSRSLMLERVEAALARTGLLALKDRAVAGLSGGERQRVALAGALALEPRLLALDEPTSQLDRDGTREIIHCCADLAAAGTAVVIAEQRLERLLAVAGRVLEVLDGRLERPPLERWPAPPAARPRPSSRGAPAFELRDVTAGPGPRAVVEGVDLAGCAGETLALMGPNGGGKTTLLRVIAGVLRPLAGFVERRPGRVAYLPQNPAALLHRPTVLDEVELTISRTDGDGSAWPLLEHLGLEKLAWRYPRDLSTGERQRAAIAAVLAGRPRLALLDEPTRGMDDRARTALVSLVASLAGDGACVVVATHDEQLVRAVAGRVLRVADGRVREEAPA